MSRTTTLTSTSFAALKISSVFMGSTEEAEPYKASRFFSPVLIWLKTGSFRGLIEHVRTSGVVGADSEF